ncbi:DUF1990 family protein [Streptomyces sp. NPDC058953]|uniref:DUF1990 family protein n=1 Tax=Streptomyces sp. NPDC058953 TaxID=3346676 RepID=UPI0036C9E6BB
MGVAHMASAVVGLVTRLVERASGGGGAPRPPGGLVPLRAVPTYPETGATRLGPMPDGYSHLHHTVRIGRGRAVYEAAGAAVLDWRMHGASGTRPRTTGPRAEPGTQVEVSLGVGPLRISGRCAVVWAETGGGGGGRGRGDRPGRAPPPAAGGRGGGRAGGAGGGG